MDFLIAGSFIWRTEKKDWRSKKHDYIGDISHRVLIRTRLKMHYFDMKCVCFQSAYVQYASFNILFHIEILDFINL